MRLGGSRGPAPVTGGGKRRQRQKKQKQVKGGGVTRAWEAERRENFGLIEFV